MFSAAYFRRSAILSLVGCVGLAFQIQAGPAEDAEAAAQALARDQENQGYMFRADARAGDLQKDLGKQYGCSFSKAMNTVSVWPCRKTQACMSQARCWGSMVSRW